MLQQRVDTWHAKIHAFQTQHHKSKMLLWPKRTAMTKLVFIVVTLHSGSPGYIVMHMHMHTVLDPEWTIDDLLDIRIWTDTTPGVVLVVVILSTRTRVFWSRSAPKCINQCACVTSQTIDRKATTHDSVVSGHVRTPHFSHLRVEISHWCCLSTYSLVGAVKWVDVN